MNHRDIPVMGLATTGPMPHVGRREFRESMKTTMDTVHEVGAIALFNGTYREAVVLDIALWDHVADEARLLRERWDGLRLMATALKAGVPLPGDIADWLDAEVDHDALKRFRSTYRVNATGDEDGPYAVIDHLPETTFVDDDEDEIEFLHA